MSWSQTMELAARIKPELVAAELVNIERVKDGVYMPNIFRRTMNINDDRIVIRKTDRDLTSIPFVAEGEQGVAKASPDYTDTAHTVPEMKIHARIRAKDLKRAGRYKQQDFMTWLRENYLVQMRFDTDMTLEFLKRYCLYDGNMSWPYLTSAGYDTFSLSLGTAYAGGALTNLWSTSGTTLAQIHDGIRGLIRAAQASDGYYQYFSSSSDIVVLCPDAMFTLAFAKLNGHQTIDTVPASIVDENTIKVGSYIFKSFGASYKNPQTKAYADAITAKTVRIVDKSMNANHVLAMLELDNLQAEGNNRHYLIQVVPHELGEYVDIVFRMRPVAAFNPYAMITATVSA